MGAPAAGAVRDQIREVLAGATGLPLGHVSVKATRGEGMGFVGRGEGAAALAVVTLEGPDPGPDDYGVRSQAIAAACDRLTAPSLR